MESKKQVVVGAAMVVIILWTITDLITAVIRSEQYLPSSYSGITAFLIGIAMTFYAIAAVVLGIWGVLKPFNKFEEWSKRFTLTASIPGYFLLALIPVWAGLFIIVLTRETEWGLSLSCLSFISILIFLALALRRIRGS